MPVDADSLILKHRLLDREQRMSEPKFNIDRFLSNDGTPDQYERQLRRLTSAGKSVTSIEQAVRGPLDSLDDKHGRSFVIYGEPQSGKTEMMICLTAKLLDTGRDMIVHLLNDSVDLLGQIWAVSSHPDWLPLQEILVRSWILQSNSRAKKTSYSAKRMEVISASFLKKLVDGRASLSSTMKRTMRHPMPR